MGMGLYELYVDGKKVGDQVLAPAPTDYTKNIKYNALDLTKALKQGKLKLEDAIENENEELGLLQCIIVFDVKRRSTIKT